MTVELWGYRFSVYSWIARLTLAEKSVGYRWVEVNPFEQPVPQNYLDLNPFNRVPTLVHDGFVVYETGALTRYIDEAFPGPSLQPQHPRERARLNQMIAIIDQYGYWPMVRQVFSHGVFRPRFGEPADPSEFRQGLETSTQVLSALEKLAGGKDFLIGDELSLADVHLAPMTAYFAMAPEGAEILQRYEKLAYWWERMSRRRAVVATQPELPE